MNARDILELIAWLENYYYADPGEEIRPEEISMEEYIEFCFTNYPN